jgi:hypothetical protein
LETELLQLALANHIAEEGVDPEGRGGEVGDGVDAAGEDELAVKLLDLGFPPYAEGLARAQDGGDGEGLVLDLAVDTQGAGEEDLQIGGVAGDLEVAYA